MPVNPATALAITQGVKFLLVSWTNSTTSGARHTVYRSRGANGCFVPVASNILTPYTDADVSAGETYAYYIVATATGESSVPSNTSTLTYVGPQDPYATEVPRGAVTVYAGVVAAGCGEYQRLQRLRGQAIMCGK